MKSLYAGLCAGVMLALILTCAGCAEIAEGAGDESYFGMGQTPAATPTPTPAYMTVETPYPTQMPESAPTYGKPPATTPSTEASYFEIYNTSHRFNYDTVAMSFDLEKAPMIIEYSVSPDMVERVKEGTSQYGDKDEYSVTTTVPSDMAAFSVKVFDKNTGELIIDEGYGRIYGYQEEQTLYIRTPGFYQIELTGAYVDATIFIWVNEGNF
jgi:hypothetical protein